MRFLATLVSSLLLIGCSAVPLFHCDSLRLAECVCTDPTTGAETIVEIRSECSAQDIFNNPGLNCVSIPGTTTCN
ncbi:hypothetical protein SISNIDRAFT_452378 [Sistotremastrum niveocremeum HHB9708]|uniref:Extracellular membrane protein CFEM domain-containing protein n=1 Tax=Sistotremastrum niveocremeum HHB9708 TaxID=1314777 RepID=A0A164WI73_9AGAM|nr:hypothetical protein SISNIDRAFT_452378 [Sistotremastrum niveocremeum HHB9708]